MARPRFLCDEMLAGFARWLRSAGLDTRAAPAGAEDAELLRQARREGRWFLSRDRKIAEHKAARDTLLLLEGQCADDWARQLGEAFDLDWTAHAFSRCVLCNAPLQALPASQRHRLPPERRHEADVHWCPICRKPYWTGDHVRRMRRRLQRWASRCNGAIRPGRGRR